MLGAGRTANLTEKSMELLGILVVVLWALPMYVAMFVVLMLVTYVAGLSEALPRYFGLIE